MSSPAVGAKLVAAIVVGVVGAGTFAGVSHDGRGEGSSVDPDPIVEVPPTSTGSGATSPSSTITAQTSTASSSEPVDSLQPAEPATPDPVPAPTRLRSRGS